MTKRDKSEYSPRPDIILKLALVDQKIAYWSDDQAELHLANEALVAELHARNHTRRKRLSSRGVERYIEYPDVSIFVDHALQQQATAEASGNLETIVTARQLVSAAQAALTAQYESRERLRIDN